MYRIFQVHTTKSSFILGGGKRREIVKEPITLDVQMRIAGTTIFLGYGYKHWTTEHTEGFDSVCPGQKYTLHHSLRVLEGDVWKYGNRVFVVGKPEGFLVYKAPLLENGKQVATVCFEDYYKD